MQQVTSLYVFNNYVAHLSSIAKVLNYELSERIGRVPTDDNLKSVLVFNLPLPLSGNIYATSTDGCIGEFKLPEYIKHAQSEAMDNISDRYSELERLDMFSAFGKISKDEEGYRVLLGKLLGTINATDLVEYFRPKELSDKDTKQ